MGGDGGGEGEAWRSDQSHDVVTIFGVPDVVDYCENYMAMLNGDIAPSTIQESARVIYSSYLVIVEIAVRGGNLLEHLSLIISVVIVLGG